MLSSLIYSVVGAGVGPCEGGGMGDYWAKQGSQRSVRMNVDLDVPDSSTTYRLRSSEPPSSTTSKTSCTSMEGGR